MSSDPNQQSLPQHNEPRAVYIHIPFCTNKCFYCDFNSYVVNGQPVDEYLDALDREFTLTLNSQTPQPIGTVFVGGGTPTVLTPAQMERFLAMVNRHFPLKAPGFEFTMEANPGTTDLPKLQAMRAGGVNRLSFGVQSFDNRLLERIGRIHNTDDVYASIANAQAAGFENLSIDLMFGLPDQTVETMERTLDEALKLDLKHYSIYSLKVEENTLFHTLYQKDKLPLPGEDDELAMFLNIIRRLQGEGYRHYEISNFAKPGFASKHNTVYWRNESYYGFGAGAHGYANGLRHMNIKGVRPYIEAAQSGLPRLETRAVGRNEAMEDFMMVGLRLLDGMRNADFAAQFGVAPEAVFGGILERLTARGLLARTEQGYRLAEEAIPLGNEVFAEFIGVLE